MTFRKIINGLVFHEDGSFTPDTVYICGEKIVSQEVYEKECSTASGNEMVTDAAGNYVIPGLTDIHFHGCMGSDCCDGTVEAFQTIARYELSQGITSITPATMTMSEEVLSQICRAAKTYRDTAEENAADFCGLYMEGPFINAAKKGAQNEKYITPADTAMLNRLQDLSGNMLRTVAIAPETAGAMDFIRENSSRVNISIAHTTADYDTAKEAIACGASQLTHTYNAMPPFSHRAPGPIGAAADDDHCRAELICDGIHIHPAVVRTTFKMFGDDRIIFISDSMRAAGLADGQYDLGGQNVTVKGNLAVLEDGTIAGSVTNLMDCVRTAVHDMGIPFASAVKCAAVNPAKAVGIYDAYGSLTPGKFANIVILDKNLDIKTVLHHGI
ncbi:MAG: N-acetylglucosamine-6-phosphate deacetylase [Lachnospiraceae bacterium]|jgi:N-acetylglucosamine-6-phosphate deacetylase|nr:N-acetylglucosamine-6-phosphate deacetylase [Lachnospiraceae bacterium]